MKEAVLEDKRKFAIAEVPDPVTDKDEVLIKVQYCGICGGDLHIFKEGAGVGPGHEFSGDIVEIGSDVKGWKIGDRVAFEPNVSCGKCFWCRQGDLGLCEQFYVELIRFKGGFATYAKAKHYNLHKLPEDMSYEQGALVEPTTCALHAVKLSGLQEGDVVAVDGSFADKEIKLQVGDTLEVALESNPTTGFQWVLVENSDEIASQQVGHVYVPYGNTDPPLPGVGGKELWTFKALQKGETTITMEYSQLWEGGMKAAKTFVLTVVIK